MDKKVITKPNLNNKVSVNKDIHLGHRQRMKDKFIEAGIGAFADHEKLEMLLYYTNKVKDTNAIAHALIKEFGSLENVLKADLEYLEKIKGVGKETAFLIKYIHEFGIYMNESVINNAKAPIILKDADVIGRYCCGYFKNKSRESLIALLLNAEAELIRICTISKGTVDRTAIFNREIVECALKHKANGVILAHNHPGKCPNPSNEDVACTVKIDRVLSDMDIVFVDHFVCTGDTYTSMRYRNLI